MALILNHQKTHHPRLPFSHALQEEAYTVLTALQPPVSETTEGSAAPALCKVTVSIPSHKGRRQQLPEWLSTMRRFLLRTMAGAFALTGSILFVPEAAVAGMSLSPIMESWNHSRRSIDAMLAGEAPYDEARIRQELQRFVATSSRVASGLNGASAEGRDFAARFRAFADESQTVLGHVAEPSALRASFRRVAGDCQSCHATYNN